MEVNFLEKLTLIYFKFSMLYYVKIKWNITVIDLLNFINVVSYQSTSYIASSKIKHSYNQGPIVVPFIIVDLCRFPIAACTL